MITQTMNLFVFLTLFFAYGTLALPLETAAPKGSCPVQLFQAEVASQARIAPSTQKDAVALDQAQASGSNLPPNAKYATSGPSPIRFDR